MCEPLDHDWVAAGAWHVRCRHCKYQLPWPERKTPEQIIDDLWERNRY